MNNINPMLLCDFYKISHREQYPKGTQYIYSTWTPRESRISGIDHVIAFGFQGFIKEYLIDYFNHNFFSAPVNVIVDDYKRFISNTLNIKNPETKHIEELHQLGYLPIKIQAVPEGTAVPIRCPMLTIENTDPRFFWLTNFLETVMSNHLWMPSTSATIAREYRKILSFYANETGGDALFVPFQAHDFSMRGHSSLSSSIVSGAGHLTSFVGTDTIPAICYCEKYYNANITEELVGCSIPATEHSVMCAYGQDELESYRKILTEIYPSGFVSVVSDTWNLWDVLNVVIRKLKPEIMNRDGKLVIRPDSGDPIKIICGDEESDSILERKGVIEILWDIFGGTINDKGFKQLDSHIGCIYGDAITIERCKEICKRLKDKGFSSTNMVYGVGSFTYQYVTRDTFGFALKSTYAVIDGEEIGLFKDPITDKNKIKKSQTGLVAVYNNGLKVFHIENLTRSSKELEKKYDILEDVFLDGRLVRNQSLQNIRNNILKG